MSLALTLASYVIFVFFAGGAALRDASGNLSDVINGTVIANCGTEGCAYGLHNSYSVSVDRKNS